MNSQPQVEAKQINSHKETDSKESHIHKKRHSIGESEEDYMKESFDVESPKDSFNESIKESFQKESRL